MPFDGTLDPDNRWVLFSSLMPWAELEETYAPQFNATTGAPAKPVRLAFGALFIKQRLGLTDKKTVEQISEGIEFLQRSAGRTRLGDAWGIARDFRDAQGRLNQAMAAACDRVVLVVDLWHPSLSEADKAVLDAPIFQRFGKAAA